GSGFSSKVTWGRDCPRWRGRGQASFHARAAPAGRICLCPPSFRYSMHHSTFVSLLRAVLSTPTAPFHEYHVARLVEERLAGLPHVRLHRDAFGNLIACYRRGRRPARLAFAAHMDHPGWLRQGQGETFL